MTQENALRIFKCLSDMSRLRIVRSLMQGELYTELLSERLGLTPSTVSFHMKKLEEAGLVTSRKEQYYTVYTLNGSLTKLRLSDLICGGSPAAEDEAQRREEEYRQKVLKAFFEGDTLRSIPVQRKKKLICYQHIARLFEPGRVYEEKELSDIIASVHEDYCTIRRDMISEGILTRENGKYVRIK